MKRDWTSTVGLLPVAEDELPPQKRRKVSTAEAQRRRERRERRGIRELSLPLRPLRSLRLCGEGIGIAVDRVGQQADICQGFILVLQGAFGAECQRRDVGLAKRLAAGQQP